MSLTDSDSEDETVHYTVTDVMELFVSDSEAREFSGFSANDIDNVAKTQRTDSVKPKNKKSKATVSDENRPSTSKAQGKSTGKGKKGKAPLKRTSTSAGEAETPAKKSKDDTDNKRVEFQSFFDLLENAFDTYLVNNQTAQAEASRGDNNDNNGDPDTFFDNIVDLNDNESLDVNNFNVFGQEDENNNIESEEFVFEMPKIFEDDVKFGQETLPCISELVNTIVHKKANLDDMLKDMKLPSNCKNLIPPKVNAEIWSFLRRTVKSLDLTMQHVQKLLGFGICSTIRSAELLSKKEFEVKDLRKHTQNAMTILSSVFFELSYARKMALKPNLEPKYHLLCTKNEEIGLNLFGDDVTKRIKEINEAQKTQGTVCKRGGFTKNFFVPRGSGARGRRSQTPSFAAGSPAQAQFMERPNFSNRSRGRGQFGYTRRPRRY